MPLQSAGISWQPTFSSIPVVPSFDSYCISLGDDDFFCRWTTRSMRRRLMMNAAMMIQHVSALQWA
jgi:hypothetical protein